MKSYPIAVIAGDGTGPVSEGPTDEQAASVNDTASRAQRGILEACIVRRTGSVRTDSTHL